VFLYLVVNIKVM